MAPSPQPPNVYLLAADNSPSLLPLLRNNPALASSQDEHGYSLVHAAASYNHLDLLRALVSEFGVNVNIRDEDGETALFSVETLEAAKCLVEELEADWRVLNADGATARERIEAEEDYPEVVAYIRSLEAGAGEAKTNGAESAKEETPEESSGPPTLPPNVSLNFEAVENPSELEVVDSEFRRRIEELATREDFQGADGQAQLRELITEAVRGHVVDGADAQGREVRRRID
jgi:hypothetical protein